jgi:hypothetical protein
MPGAAWLERDLSSLAYHRTSVGVTAPPEVGERGDSRNLRSAHVREQPPEPIAEDSVERFSTYGAHPKVARWS